MLECANGVEIKVGSALTTDYIIFWKVIKIQGIQVTLKNAAGVVINVMDSSLDSIWYTV